MSLLGKNDTDVFKTVSGFGFSAVKTDQLGASEYTLVQIVTDVSGSVSPYVASLNQSYKTILESCAKSPRADNLLVRAVDFDHDVTEKHGFIGLNQLDPNAGNYSAGGNTALYDAILSSIEATEKYGETLTSQGYLVNAVIFVVTDGADNTSRIGSPAKIAKVIEDLRRSEKLESVKVILIGVGDSSYVQGYLDTLNTDAKLDQFVWIDKTDAKSLAKMADFISRSISSSSQSLGTGGPSQNLTV